jgi:hypothetical protein
MIGGASFTGAISKNAFWRQPDVQMNRRYYSREMRHEMQQHPQAEPRPFGRYARAQSIQLFPPTPVRLKGFVNV